jgi:hypothetical protein
VRRAAALLALCALALSGCESTQEKNAKLEQHTKHVKLAQTGLSITHASHEVKVTATTVLRNSEVAAAVVSLHNTSPHALLAVPIAITVKDASGRTLFQNDTPGLEAALTSVSSIAPGARLTWVDDQVPPSGAPVSVSAVLGQAPSASQRLPRLRIGAIHNTEDPASGAGVTGTVSNPSAVAQRNLVVFAIARRAGRVVAAGRAVLTELPAGASNPFQVFFVGDPRGGHIEVSAPASTAG